MGCSLIAISADRSGPNLHSSASIRYTPCFSPRVAITRWPENAATPSRRYGRAALDGPRYAFRLVQAPYRLWGSSGPHLVNSWYVNSYMVWHKTFSSRHDELCQVMWWVMV